jgi:hypothetical protein
MITRILAIGLILAASVVAIIVWTGVLRLDRPSTTSETPIQAASAQKRGGVLRIYQYDSPASMSIHEEAFNSAQNRV